MDRRIPRPKVSSIVGRPKSGIRKYFSISRKVSSGWGIVSSDTIVRIRQPSSDPQQEGEVLKMSKQIPSCPTVTSTGYYQFGLPSPTATVPPTPLQTSKGTNPRLIPTELMDDIPLFSPTRRFSSESRMFRGPRVYREGKTVTVEQNLSLPTFDTEKMSVRELFQYFSAVKNAKTEASTPRYARAFHHTSTDSVPALPLLDPNSTPTFNVNTSTYQPLIPSVESNTCNFNVSVPVSSIKNEAFVDEDTEPFF